MWVVVITKGPSTEDLAAEPDFGKMAKESREGAKAEGRVLARPRSRNWHHVGRGRTNQHPTLSTVWL